tara:strand:- start:59 stop:607 length:549 start_codon:yes stop_codon:yes gene_type:complete
LKDLRKIKKYADSLIKVSKKTDTDIKEIIKNLSSFNRLVREIPELRYLLLSKRISLETKSNSMKNLFNNYFEDIGIEFILILIENNHVGMLKDVIEKLNSMNQSIENIKNIHVASFIEITEDDKNEIIEEIKSRFNVNDSSEASFSIDKKLQGGIKVRIGNKIIDGSVSTKLKKIKESLLSI